MSLDDPKRGLGCLPEILGVVRPVHPNAIQPNTIHPKQSIEQSNYSACSILRSTHRLRSRLRSHADRRKILKVVRFFIIQLLNDFHSQSTFIYSGTVRGVAKLVEYRRRTEELWSSIGFSIGSSFEKLDCMGRTEKTSRGFKLGRRTEETN